MLRGQPLKAAMLSTIARDKISQLFARSNGDDGS